MYLRAFTGIRRTSGTGSFEGTDRDDQVFRQVSDTQTPQGIMAVVRQQENSLDAIMKQPDALLLFLENIQDPGNLGTMMRTAEGAGVTGIIMSRETTDIYNPKTIRLQWVLCTECRLSMWMISVRLSVWQKHTSEHRSSTATYV